MNRTIRPEITATLPRRAAQIFPFPQTDASFVLGLADADDREEIFRLRHEIYARELGQHSLNQAGALRDQLDEVNLYLTARCGGEIAGFVSITPPRAPSFSVDKYFARTALPFAFDGRLYEVRLLTVLQPHRGRELATLLMYAAYRWVESHGGTRIVGIGRREVMDLYRRVGLVPAGLSTQSGAVTYDLVVGTIAGMRQKTVEFSPVLARLEARTAWRLPFPFRPRAFTAASSSRPSGKNSNPSDAGTISSTPTCSTRGFRRHRASSRRCRRTCPGCCGPRRRPIARA